MADREKPIVKDRPACWVPPLDYGQLAATVADRLSRRDEPHPLIDAEAPTAVSPTPAEASPTPVAPETVSTTLAAPELVSPPPAPRAWMPDIRVQFSRVQMLLLWATISGVLLLTMYPTTTLHFWDLEGAYHDINPRNLTEVIKAPWLREVGARKLITSVPQWRVLIEGNWYWFKEEPDYRSMRLECGLVAFIGLGLMMALGRWTSE
jgi:hypothetical protein